MLLTLVVGSGSALAVRQAVDGGPATLPPPWFAPYVDATITPVHNFEDPSANPADDVVLGFVVADRGGDCVPTWGTYFDLERARTDLDLDRRIARLRQRGGDIIVSFGGAANDELATSCSSDDDLHEAYESVVDQYDVTTLDFDIEGSALTNDAANQRRARVVKELQDAQREAGDELAVWLTLPVTPIGMTADAVAVVDGMLAAGIDLAGVNLMTMNYGESRVGESMFEATKHALEGSFRQLEASYRRAGMPLSDLAVWRKIGATPMIGQNDVATDRFTLEDAEDLLDYAQSRGLARLSLWSLNRDIACGAQLDTEVVSNQCSGVAQDALEFTTLFGGLPGRVADAAESRTVVEPASEPVDDPATSPYPVWRDNKAYVKGDKVTWHHNVYEAKWWAEASAMPDEPVVNEWDTPWRLIGPVMPGDRPVPALTVPDGTYAEWDKSIGYTMGDRVQLDGVPFIAKWWVRGDAPEAAPIDPYTTPWQLLDEADLEDDVEP